MSEVFLLVDKSVQVLLSAQHLTDCFKVSPTSRQGLKTQRISPSNDFKMSFVFESASVFPSSINEPAAASCLKLTAIGCLEYSPQLKRTFQFQPE